MCSFDQNLKGFREREDTILGGQNVDTILSPPIQDLFLSDRNLKYFIYAKALVKRIGFL